MKARKQVLGRQGALWGRDAKLAPFHPKEESPENNEMPGIYGGAFGVSGNSLGKCPDHEKR